VCVLEANLGKVAKSCTAEIKGSIFKKLIKTILPKFVQNTVLGLNTVSMASDCSSRKDV